MGQQQQQQYYKTQASKLQVRRTPASHVIHDLVIEPLIRLKSKVHSWFMNSEPQKSEQAQRASHLSWLPSRMVAARFYLWKETTLASVWCRSRQVRQMLSPKRVLPLFLGCILILLITISHTPESNDPFKLADRQQLRASYSHEQFIDDGAEAASQGIDETHIRTASATDYNNEIRDHFESVPNAKTSKYAVVTMHSNWHDYKWANCSFVLPKKRYCERHGYPYFDETLYMEEKALPLKEWMRSPEKRPRFRKLQYLEMLLRANLNFEWFLWIDGDAIFQNQEWDIENRLAAVRERLSQTEINAPSDDPVFVLAQDYNGINNGVWLIRNTPEVHQLILDIFDTYASPKNLLADQLSLVNYLMMHQQFFRDRVWLLQERDMHLIQTNPATFWQIVKWVSTMLLGQGRRNEAPWIFHLPGRKMWQRKNILESRGLLCGTREPANRVWLEQMVG